MEIAKKHDWSDAVDFDRSLLCYMHVINLLTLPIFLTPLYFKYVLSFPSVRLTHVHTYTYSFHQFMADPFLLGYYSPIPLPALDVGSVTVYFPGLFIDCLLGAIQGIILGLNLHRRGSKGNLRAPVLPAVALILFGVMEIAALPLHCLKEISWLDIESRSLLTNLLFWIDTFCTTNAYPAMFLSGLVECRFLSPNKGQRMYLCVLPFTAIMSALGVFLPNRWICCVLHVISLSAFTTPLFFMTGRRVKRLRCPHGYGHMKLSMLIFGLLGYGAFTVLPSFVSTRTHGQLDPLTAIFVGCRIGLCHYYAYCMCQRECDCWEEVKHG